MVGSIRDRRVFPYVFLPHLRLRRCRSERLRADGDLPTLSGVQVRYLLGINIHLLILSQSNSCFALASPHPITG